MTNKLPLLSNCDKKHWQTLQKITTKHTHGLYISVKSGNMYTGWLGTLQCHSLNIF